MQQQPEGVKLDSTPEAGRPNVFQLLGHAQGSQRRHGRCWDPNRPFIESVEPPSALAEILVIQSPGSVIASD